MSESNEQYKGHTIKRDSHGCWVVLDKNGNEKGSYPNSGMAKSAIDVLEVADDLTEQSITLKQMLAYLDGSGEINGYGFGEVIPGKPKFWWRPVLKQLITRYGLEQRKAAVEKARSSDPLKCEYGHKVYGHKTANGWCCACEADIAFLENQIEESKK